MAKMTRKSISKANTRVRVIKEITSAYGTLLTLRAVYRNGRFEPQEPVTNLGENQSVELVVRTGLAAESTAPDQRATQILRRAKLRAANLGLAPQMTPDDARAAYDKAASALRRALRRSQGR